MALITVTTAANSGSGSLREAIASASSGDTVAFSSELANKTIRLDEQLVIDKDITLDGAAAPNLTLSGEDKTRILHVDYSYVDVVVRNLTFANGRAADSDPNKTQQGGAIELRGPNTLVVENSRFINNSAERGGAIHVGYGASATVVGSEFDGNDGSLANDGFSAGAISTQGGGEGAKVVNTNGDRNVGGEAFLDIRDSTFTNNKGSYGAVYTLLGGLRVEDSVFRNNEGTRGAGAIFTDGANGTERADNLGGTTLIRNVIAENNTGGGDYGGAFFLYGYSGDKYIIENTQVIGNEARRGGGIGVQSARDEDNGVELIIRDSVIADNTASSQGGGLWTDVKGGVTIEDSTFDGNRVSTSDGKGDIGGAIVLNTPESAESTITNTTFTDNYADRQSGNIWIGGKNKAENLTVEDSSFAGNRAGSRDTENTVNFEVKDGGGNIVQGSTGVDGGLPGATLVEELQLEPTPNSDSGSDSDGEDLATDSPPPEEPAGPDPVVEQPKSEPTIEAELPTVEEQPEPVAEEPVAKEQPKPEPTIEAELPTVEEQPEPVAEEPAAKEQPKPEPTIEAEPPTVEEQPEPMAEEPVAKEQPKLEPTIEAESPTVEEQPEPVAEEPAAKEQPKPKPEPTIEAEPPIAEEQPEPMAEEPVAKEQPKLKPEPTIEAEPPTVEEQPEPKMLEVNPELVLDAEDPAPTPAPDLTDEPEPTLSSPDVVDPQPANPQPIAPQPAPNPLPTGQSPTSEPESPESIEPIRFDAEDLTLKGYRLRNEGNNPDNRIATLKSGNRIGKAKGVFDGPAGTYQIKLGYFDESDGQGSFKVKVAGNSEFFELDEDLPSKAPNARSKTERITHEAIDLEPGDRFLIRGKRGGNEFARFDYIEFSPVEANPQAPQSSPNSASYAAGGLVDLRSVDYDADGIPDEQVSLSLGDITSFARYDNSGGFYRAERRSGAVRDPLTDELVRPGQKGYAEAALKQRVSGLSFQAEDGQVSSKVETGAFLAPYLITNGTAETFLEQNPRNDRTPDRLNAYFGMSEANPDGLDHLKSPGGDRFAFEDLYGLGDKSFDDLSFTVDVDVAI